jgi:Tfp pilus assembly protein PilO
VKLAQRNLWKRWRLDVAWAGVCVLVTLVAYLAGIEPALDQRAQRRDRTNQIQAQETRYAELATSLRVTREALAGVEKQLMSSSVRLEAASQVNGRVAQLTDLVGACGMTIDEIEPGTVMPSLPGAQFDILPITLKGVGTFPTCSAFLRRLREVFPDTSVTAFELSGRRGATSPSVAAAGSSTPSVAPVAYRIGLLWYTAPIGAH